MQHKTREIYIAIITTSKIWQNKQYSTKTNLHNVCENTVSVCKIICTISANKSINMQASIPHKYLMFCDQWVVKFVTVWRHHNCMQYCFQTINNCTIVKTTNSVNYRFMLFLVTFSNGLAWSTIYNLTETGLDTTQWSHVPKQ